MTLTRNEIGPLFQECVDTLAAWDANDEPQVIFQQRPTKALSGAVVEAWIALIEAAGTMDVEPTLKPAVLAIDDFEDALRDWSEDCEVNPGETHPGGNKTLFGAWSAVVEEMSHRSYSKPESISTLEKQRVSDRQIALIYGWTDSQGEPDASMVREERENPGTHYNSETWIHPAERSRIEAAEQSWPGRQRRVDETVAASHTKREAPESIEELINQRVSSKQIAEMKNVTVEQVKEVARSLGLPIDGQIVEPVASVSPAGRLDDLRRQEAEIEAEMRAEMLAEQQKANEATTVVDKVLTLHLDDKKPGEIAEALKSDYPNLTTQKVVAIIKQADEGAADPVVS